MDRLLRPNMTLSNPMQSKQFNGGREAATKTAVTHSFFARTTPTPKKFGDTRSFLARIFGTHEFSRGNKTAVVPQHSSPESKTNTFATQSSDMPRNLSDGEKRVETSDFAGNRPFLGRGKSQKSFDQQKAPLTIEQVRDLLNRNK